MDKVLNMEDFLAAAEGDAEHVLGKFLYFSLANLLVDKDELSELCDSMDILVHLYVSPKGSIYLI